MKNQKILDRTEKLNDGFRVPEGYFDTLPERVQKTIASKDGGKIIHLNKYFNFKNIAIASSIAAVIISGLIIVPALIDQNKNNNLETGSIIEQELTNESLLYDESLALQVGDEYTESIIDNDIELIPVEEHLAADTAITDQDIIEYLENEEIDADMLAELY